MGSTSPTNAVATGKRLHSSYEPRDQHSIPGGDVLERAWNAGPLQHHRFVEGLAHVPGVTTITDLRIDPRQLNYSIKRLHEHTG